MPSPLPNYLRSHRKRLGLSQDDVAFLLGAMMGSKICRFERFVRDPSLQMALGFAAILQTPIEQLFTGISSKIERQIMQRARVLAHRIQREGQTKRNVKRLQILQKIGFSLENKTTRS